MGGPGSGRKKGSKSKSNKSKWDAYNKSIAKAKAGIKAAKEGKSSASNITWNSRSVRISGK